MALELAPIQGGWVRAEMQHHAQGHDAAITLSTAEDVRLVASLGSLVGELHEPLFDRSTREYFSQNGILHYLAGIELGPRIHGSKTAEHVRWLQPPVGLLLPTPDQLFDAPDVPFCDLWVAGSSFPRLASWLLRMAPVTTEKPNNDPRVRFLKTINNA